MDYYGRYSDIIIIVVITNEILFKEWTQFYQHRNELKRSHIIIAES